MSDESLKPVRTLAFYENMYDQYCLMLLSKIIDKDLSNAEHEQIRNLMKEVGIRAVNEPGTPTAKLLAHISIHNDEESTQHLPFPILKQNTQG